MNRPTDLLQTDSHPSNGQTYGPSFRDKTGKSMKMKFRNLNSNSRLIKRVLKASWKLERGNRIEIIPDSTIQKFEEDDEEEEEKEEEEEEDEEEEEEEDEEEWKRKRKR